jgi:hypothetical protein
VSAVAASLTASGLTHQLGTGYREFADERRRSDPNWRGFTLTPEQTFLLVLGRRE